MIMSKCRNLLTVLVGALLPSMVLATTIGSARIEDVESVTTPSTTPEPLAVSTVRNDVYPLDIDPVFWLDASDTSGWTFSQESSAAIVSIPSKTGGRSLTTDLTGASWTGWGGVGLSSPELTQESRLRIPAAVDFGEFGSRRGFVFSPVSGSSELGGMKTIVAVYDSTQGGGFFMAGCYGNDREGYGWHRGNSIVGTGTFEWNSPVFHEATQDGARHAMIRHNGVPTWGLRAPFVHGWEVISVVSPESESMQATGLGFGDGRNGFEGYSGGMKVAELLAFDRVLTADQLLAVEAYLNAKWFGRNEAGFGGNAEVGRLRLAGKTTDNASESQTSTAVDVPAGETLTVGELRGGRGGGESKLTKTGAGTLRIGEAGGFGGAVDVAAGKLERAGRRIPSRAELPHDLYLDFDASAAGTVERTGDSVTGWGSSVESLYKGETLRAAATAEAHRPTFVADALGEGLHALDFRALEDESGNGGYLAFVTKSGEATESDVKEIDGLCTFLVVVNVQEGGGFLFDCNAFIRDGAYHYGSDIVYPTQLVTRQDTLPVVHSDDMPIWLDGTRIAAANAAGRHGFGHPGWHVVAVQTPGSDIRYIGARADRMCGGMKFAEIMIWNRPLAEAEILDASAYLARKWLGRSLAGYAVEDPEALSVQTLSSSGAGEIAVGAGDDLRVGSLKGPGILTKTGSGTLSVESADPASGTLAVAEGTIRAVGPATVSAKCEVAKNAALHLDASNAANLTLFEEGGYRRVRNWVDESGLAGVWCARQGDTSGAPWLNTTDTCNGLPVVDFGTYGGTDGSVTKGKYAVLHRPVDAVRHAYVVWGTQNGGGTVLGSYSKPNDSADLSDTSDCYDFLRGENGGALLLDNPNTQCARRGEILIDGEPFDWSDTPKTGYQLLEFHLQGSAHVSALCNDRWEGSGAGGARIGEILLYDRELTAREKVATRNYLMRKWFGKADGELADLPEESAKVTFGEVRAAGELGVLDAERPVSVARLSGEGALRKDGAADLEIADLSAFRGTLKVAEGAARLSGSGAVGSLVTDGRILHVDATQGLVCETNANGLVFVKEWKSVLNDGWSAVAHSINDRPPTVMQKANGSDPGFPARAADMPAVDMMAGSDYENYFLFTKDGVQTELRGIRSVFWVIGSQRGGGFLLGGGTVEGTPRQFAWFRGDASGTGTGDGRTASDKLLAGYAFDPAVTYGAWRMNGEPVKPNGEDGVGMSGGWDLISMTCDTTRGLGYSTADGFGFDGRVLVDQYQTTCGAQRLAEVIVYDRVLSAEEIAQNEAYLKAKWGFARPGMSAARVEIAADATLDCGGGDQQFASLAGAGTVANATVAVDRLVADATAEAVPTLDGTLTLAEAQVVELRNIGSLLDSATDAIVRVKVLEVPEVKGLEYRKQAVFVGETVPEGWKARLAHRDGFLSVEFRPCGSLILIR